MINFALHDIVLCAKLELQVLRVSQLSVGWFVLAARLVIAHLDFYALWVKQNDFCCFKDVTYINVKTTLIKTVIGDVVAHLQPQKFTVLSDF